ncbi:MAG: hypothetical protein ACREGG_02415 [Candidatus Saccharimonadales bacterium]
MMKKLIILLLLVSTLSAGLFIYHSKPAAAAFNANDVIDDFTFDDTTTLTAAQIDSWLNSNFPSSCISTNNGFSAPDPTGYSPNPSQFFYSSTPVSAGQVIYDAAQAYGVNPQVLLTTLEKEESLVSGGAGCASWQYASAVGYGCTDSGTNTHSYSYPGGGLVTPLYYTNGNPVDSITNSCVNSGPKTGFSEQIIHASWLLAFGRHKSEGDTGWAVIKGNWDNCDDNNTCPSAWGIPASDACYGGPMTEGYFKLCPTDTSTTYFDGYATIDGTSVHMDNGATAALYWYTPHLNGNQSFDTIFNQYFGSQYANDTFTPHPNGTLISLNGLVYMINNGTKQWITNADVYNSYGYPWFLVKAATTGDANLPSGANIDTLAPGTLFYTDNSPVYVMTYDSSGNLVKQQISQSAFYSLGYSWNNVTYVPASHVPTATASSVLFTNQHPPGTLVVDNSSGKVYLLDFDQTAKQFVKRWILGPDAFTTNNYSWSVVKTASSLDLSLVDGTPVNLRQGNMLLDGGNIYLVDYDGSGVLKRPVGPWECFSNRWHYAPRDLYQLVLPGSLPARTSTTATC